MMEVSRTNNLSFKERLQMNTANSTVSGDFNSLVATIDHLSQIEDGHTRQKFVASTQTVTASILALIAYYGEQDMLINERTVKLLAEADQQDNVVFVYRTPQNVQIVTDMDTWNFACLDDDLGAGSMLKATDVLMQMTAQAEGQILEANGGRVVPLFFFSLSRDEVLPADPTAGVAAEVAAASTVEDVS
jgi:hypothetical protein